MAEWEKKRNARATELRTVALRRREERLRLGALVLVTVLIVAAGLSTGYAKAYDPARTIPVRVEAGDSLWSIAATYGPQGASTTEVIETITEINGLDHSSLMVGQILEVPTDS